MSLVAHRQLDRHFLVTGAGTGIGRAIAHRLAAEGARVSLFGRTTSKLDAVAHELKAQGSEAFTVGCDVRDRASVQNAVQAATDALGPLHGAIANAGMGGPNFPGEGDQFDALIETNLIGTYSTLRAAQAALAPGPEVRHLVAISSILGRIGVPGYTGYCAAKTGIIGLVRALAAELAKHQIQVNAVCPGWVNTQMARDGVQGMATAMRISYEEALAIAMKDVPAGRMSEPEHIAGMVAWLVSEDARGVTGQGLDMNGGAWMG
jgi:NAD(P)-dependent dehydrogenase (short-subunit alcohol dehydrogenase family)